MKLYNFPLSGHAHRAHLFLSLAGEDHELIFVDLASGEHKGEKFRALNVFEQVPVLDDGGVVVPDSNAIMVYVAKKLKLSKWYPEDAKGAADVQRWLSVAAGPLAYGPCAARLVTVFGASFAPEVVIERAEKLFRTVEEHLAGRTWLASTEHPTIADVAFYSYANHAPEGNVDLAPYTRLTSLLRRIEALPGFVPFEETSAGLRVS